MRTFTSLWLLVLISLAVLPSTNALAKKSKIPKLIPTLSVPDLIRYWGYTCEEHHVVTEDGYILGLHRIPSNRNGDPATKGPVLLGHGMLSSSSQWVFGPTDKALGYILADEGYDVWMTNIRGNIYSKNHTTLEPCSDCPEFWDFGFDDGGAVDYPTVIDYILEIATTHDKIFFVGHSMGTTQFLILNSEHPEYNEKIRAGFLLAPAIFMKHAYNPIFILADWADSLEDLLHLLGYYEFLPHPDVVTWLGHQVCNPELHPIYTEVCENVAFLLFGINPAQINETMLSVYLDHIPAGSSTRPMAQYAQLHRNDNFAKYDFGSEDLNWIHYGQTTPPEYDLTKVTVPVALFAGEKDDLSVYEDVERLASILPNVFYSELLDYPGCSHLDFAIGIDAHKYIYQPILTMMKDF